MQLKPESHQRFVQLAAGTSVVTFLMIIIGAITRVTESGMGCGPYWPSCNGHLIPAFEDITVVIEYGHRLFALLVGIFALATFVQAWRKYRSNTRILYPAAVGFALFFVQSGIGALTVAVYNQWVSVLIHLATAMCMLAAFVVTWVNARQLLTAPQQDTEDTARVYLPPVEVMLAAGLSFVVALVGAAVAGTNATKACIGWPLCSGEVFPINQGPLQVLNMVHRIVAGGLGLLLVLMLIQTSSGAARQMRNVLLAALACYLVQSALGASVVLIDNRDWLVISRALHVTFAALTWAIMIAASAISSNILWLQRLPNAGIEKPIQQVAASSATTSN
jgi:cytochrome c oxidase assembly protein subunit 15